MVRKRFAFVAALVALLVLLWATGGVVAGPPRPEAEGEISAQGDVEASAAVTYGINYQGRLTDAAGNPVPDGSYTIHFRLYDVPSGGTPLSTDTDPVSVSDGLFNAHLEFDPASYGGYFNGQALWLGIEVGSDGEMTPRQQIRPVPYALSLRPGADISGEPDTHYGLRVSNETATGIAYGVQGYSASTSGRGVYGGASANSGATYGVFGWSNSTSGTGVYGIAGATSGTTYGVYGKSDSPDGYGGYFYNNAGGTGVYGFTNSSSWPGDAGVHGESAARAPAVHGDNTSDGPGVYGTSASGAGGDFRGGFVGLYAKSEGDGYAAGFYNNTSAANQQYKSTIWCVNGGSGDLIWAAGGGGELDFRVASDGHVYSDVGFDTPASDYAELMAAEGEKNDYEPGDVLVISDDVDRAVQLSTTPYSTAVIGVYSTQPGFLGGSADKDEPGRIDGIPVAIAGIVPCKVSAENGPIHRGDLLTTSSTPGYAMKATEPKLGTILGKALGELESGTGVIDVLVILQ